MGEQNVEYARVCAHCIDCRRGLHQDCLGPSLCECSHVGLDDLQDPEAFGGQGDA